MDYQRFISIQPEGGDLATLSPDESETDGFIMWIRMGITWSQSVGWIRCGRRLGESRERSVGAIGVPDTF